MADHWDVEVQAYEMRSDYTDRTYGHRNTGWLRWFTNDSEIEQVRQYEHVIYEYKKFDIRSEGSNDYHVSEKISLRPEKPAGYDQMVIKYQDLIDREYFENNGNGPIMSHGAWHDPTTGDTPKGLKPGLQLYQPQEWKLVC